MVIRGLANGSEPAGQIPGEERGSAVAGKPGTGRAKTSAINCKPGTGRLAAHRLRQAGWLIAK